MSLKSRSISLDTILSNYEAIVDQRQPCAVQLPGVAQYYSSVTNRPHIES